MEPRENMTMSLEEMQEKLTYLLDRQAILDVIVRYCRGVDRLDRDMVMSAYHADALDDHSMFVGTPDEFWTWVQKMHGENHDSTQHMIGNHFCEIAGDVAHCETYLSYSGMNKTGAPFSAIGGRYIDRMEKRNGNWAIAARQYIVDWVAPSINTVDGSKTPEGGANYDCLKPWEFEVAATAAQPSRDAHDPSYARPFEIDPARVRGYDQLRDAATEAAP